MRRGEIWWAELPEPQESEPGGRRPVLLVQSDAFTKSKLRTAVAVILTSNLRLGEAPGNVVLTTKATGLPKDSVANVSQIVTLDKSFLAEVVGTLPHRLLQQVESGLRLVLSL